MSKNRPEAGTFDIPIQRAIFGRGLRNTMPIARDYSRAFNLFYLRVSRERSMVQAPRSWRSADEWERSNSQHREVSRPHYPAFGPLARRRGDRMRRREFITLLGGAAAWPLVARAQQAARLPTIGFLGANTPLAQSQWTTAFERRLRELGWSGGRNGAIEYRWAETRFERSPEIIAEFVRLKVDVIVTHGTTNVVAAKAATTVIPIVFAAVADPVGNNLVAGLARPGGNVTGLSAQIPDLAGKRLELLREVIPGLRRLAIMVNGGNPAAMQDLPEVQAI